MCWNISAGGDGGFSKEFMTDEQYKSFCEKVSGNKNGMYGNGYKLKGEKNGMYGKKRSKEYLEKNLIGENNPMFGKGYKISGEKNGMFGKTHSNETKLRFSKIRRDEGNPRAKSIKVLYLDGRQKTYKTMKEVIKIFDISRPTLISYIKNNKLYKKHNCYFSEIT